MPPPHPAPLDCAGGVAASALQGRACKHTHPKYRVCLLLSQARTGLKVAAACSLRQRRGASASTTPRRACLRPGIQGSTAAGPRPLNQARHRRLFRRAAEAAGPATMTRCLTGGGPRLGAGAPSAARGGERAVEQRATPSAQPGWEGLRDCRWPSHLAAVATPSAQPATAAARSDSRGVCDAVSAKRRLLSGVCKTSWQRYSGSTKN